jgi:uroporphyrinogen decarboxylase
MDHGACVKVFDNLPEDKAVMGMMWSAHFQDACAAFGMETALMKMLLEPEMFRAVIDRITDFYLEANQIFYEAGKGRLDAVLLGNDMGSQNGLMVAPEQLSEFVLPGIKKLVAQAKNYGLKVIYHSCGAIYDLIPDLIAAGVDAVHPIQALAKNMEPEKLKSAFGNKVSFCGGVDVQELLVNGSQQEVRDKIAELKSLFPTGLIISPSHEAILPDIAPENIQAMFEDIKVN